MGIGSSGITATQLATELSMTLCETSDIDAAALSNAGFATAPATVALSDQLRVGFYRYESPQNLLTYSELRQHGSTTIGLWNQLTKQLLRDSAAADGTRFLARQLCLSGLVRGIQIRPTAGTASSWLAHPELFTRLNDCAERYLGGTELTFRTFSSDLLVATTGAMDPESWAELLRDCVVAPTTKTLAVNFDHGLPILAAPTQPELAGAQPGALT